MVLPRKIQTQFKRDIKNKLNQALPRIPFHGCLYLLFYAQEIIKFCGPLNLYIKKIYPNNVSQKVIMNYIQITDIII